MPIHVLLLLCVVYVVMMSSIAMMCHLISNRLSERFENAQQELHDLRFPPTFGKRLARLQVVVAAMNSAFTRRKS